MTNEKITKERIITAAFKEWSKSCFWECSLHTVSDALGISKTALYRHFKNKEALMSSMEDVFKTSINEIITGIHDTFASQPFEKGIRLFFNVCYQFFLKYPYYLNYLVFHHIQNRAFVSETGSIGHNDYKAIQSHLSAFFLSALPSSLEDKKTYDFTLLYRGIIFFFPLYIYHSPGPDMNLSSLHLDKTLDVVSLLHQINTKGFGSGSSLPLPDYRAVECFFDFKEDIFSREKIVDAIYEVVSAEGLHKASISKIAARLGMQKSSLYHYFKSKSELIKTLLIQSAGKLNLSVRESIRPFHNPGDRLYCIIIVTAAYFYFSQPAIHLYSWLIFNKLIDKEYLRLPSLWTADRFKFFNEFFENGILKTHGLDSKVIFSYLNFNILASILTVQKKWPETETAEQAESEKKRIISSMRTLYTYFLHGILGGNNEQK